MYIRQNLRNSDRFLQIVGQNILFDSWSRTFFSPNDQLGLITKYAPPPFDAMRHLVIVRWHKMITFWEEREWTNFFDFAKFFGFFFGEHVTSRLIRFQSLQLLFQQK